MTEPLPQTVAEWAVYVRRAAERRIDDDSFVNADVFNQALACLARECYRIGLERGQKQTHRKGATSADWMVWEGHWSGELDL